MIADAGLLKDNIEYILKEKMKPRMATVFRMRHGVGYPGVCTFKEISEDLKVTPSRAREIYGQAERAFCFHAKKYRLVEFLREEI